MNPSFLILQYLRTAQSTPQAIADLLDWSLEDVETRLSQLRANKCVSRHIDYLTYYRITSEGRAHLRQLSVL